MGSGSVFPEKQGYDISSSPAKHEALAEAIRSVEPDIVALQEVRNAKQAEMLAHRLRFTSVYCSHGSSYSLDFFEWGLSFLCRYKIQHTTSRSIHFDPSSRASRLGLIADVTIAGVPVRLINVHLHHTDLPGQVQNIMRLLGPSNPTTVLMGDFNSVPEDPALAPLRHTLSDTCLLAKTQGAAEARKRGTLLRERSRMDYIFADPAVFDITEAGLIPEMHHNASDHLGYFANLELKRL
jgi:endonuclease/exonuclease/phosphatase family metal-dependent hydrolase